MTDRWEFEPERRSYDVEMAPKPTQPDRRVALLRGINVGRAKRVAMADLRRIVEGLGYREVATLLNSGNVVFTVPPGRPGDPARRIEGALEEELGVASKVIVLSASEVAAAARENRLAGKADDPSRLLAFVAAERGDLRRLDELTRRDWGREALHLGGRCAYVWCPAGLLESALGKAVNRALGDRTTSRNWTTWLRLQALLEAPQAGGTGSASSGQKTRVR